MISPSPSPSPSPSQPTTTRPLRAPSYRPRHHTAHTCVLTYLLTHLFTRPLPTDHAIILCTCVLQHAAPLTAARPPPPPRHHPETRPRSAEISRDRPPPPPPRHHPAPPWAQAAAEIRPRSAEIGRARPVRLPSPPPAEVGTRYRGAGGGIGIGGCPGAWCARFLHQLRARWRPRLTQCP